MPDKKPGIYPVLKSALDPALDDPSGYRFSRITHMHKYLESEASKYNQLQKKYKCSCKLASISGHMLTGSTAGISAGTVASILTGFGVVVALPLASLGIVLGIASSTVNFGLKKLEAKYKKHYVTTELAKSAKVVLERFLSKLIADGKVTVEEFEVAQNIEDQYKKQKQEIRESKNFQIQLRKSFLKGQRSQAPRQHTDQLADQYGKDIGVI